MQDKNMQDKVLSLLYEHAAGRMLLRPLVMPWFSEAGGRLLSTRISALAVKPFVKRNKISLEGCEKRTFDSFNDFFTRKLQDGMREIDLSEDAFISPCDGRLSLYPVAEGGRFTIKHTSYSVDSLLKNRDLARRFDGGLVWVYRLCVDDYHRYIYPVRARKSKNVKIPGVYHTVNPIANEQYPIYKENTREYCLLQTEQFGTMLMMEVGALLVGKIENHEKNPASAERGEEKGNFAFGGSTIVVITQKDRAVPLPKFRCGAGDFSQNIQGESDNCLNFLDLENRKEIPVRLGERVGTLKK